ncbi:MAG: tannase/feruloyl esterase family alpha/beta hydrolase [Pseudomonadota bacterium]
MRYAPLAHLPRLARAGAALAFALPSVAAAQAPAHLRDSAARCEALTGLRLGDTTISSTKIVPKGTAAAALQNPIASDLPAFCRVVAHIRSAPDSDIGVEIWLPLDGWAGVFHGTGNGGFAGVLQAGYGGMISGLRRGYATATTDTGTAPATMLDGDALIGHPRKWKDWGRLSTHAMTVTGKAVAAAFYGRAPRLSYYTGCSTGGQQGLIEALHYPADYDGILVGAPVINRTWGHAAVAWDFAAANRSSASLLSDAKLGLLNRAAIAECNRRGTGIAGDPFVTDPLRCTFDPAMLACRGANSDQCLTPMEMATARAFYTGPTTRDGKRAFFGWLPGSEGPGAFGWSFLQSPNRGQPQFSSLFRWVFGSAWDWRSFDLDRDMPLVDRALGDAVNDATRGSLHAFAARGGKLILYHGLADTLVPPEQTVAFYDHHARQAGGLTRLGNSARLFLAPGMMHCGGGAGPDSFNSAFAGLPQPPEASPRDDLFLALTAWREQGKAPEQVIATKYEAAPSNRIAFQRPLCAYPRQAILAGGGSTESARHFACRVRQVPVR